MLLESKINIPEHYYGIEFKDVSIHIDDIVVDVPDLKGRLGILKVHTKKILMNKRKVNLEAIAKGTPGMVGADLENIVNEAALLGGKKEETFSGNVRLRRS